MPPREASFAKLKVATQTITSSTWLIVKIIAASVIAIVRLKYIRNTGISKAL
jgi:hypothetical protein